MTREDAATRDLGATGAAATPAAAGTARQAATIRVVLPFHLRTLARVDGEVALVVAGRATQRSVLDALEARYPVLRGTIRDQDTGRRRALVRFFACGEDFSNEPPDSPLPEAIRTGAEPYLVVGAMAGG